MATFAVAGTVEVTTTTVAASRISETRFADFVRAHTGRSHAAESVLTPNLVTPVVDGNVLFVGGSWDNPLNTVPEIASISKPPGEPADWTVVPVQSSGPLGTTAAAIIQQIAYIRPETVWPATYVVEVTLTAAPPAAAITLTEFTTMMVPHVGYGVGKGVANANAPAEISAAQAPVDGIAIGFYSAETSASSNIDPDLDGGTKWSVPTTVAGTNQAKMETNWKSIYTPFDVSFARSRAGTEDVINGVLTFAVQQPRDIPVSATIPIGVTVRGDAFSNQGCAWPSAWETGWCGEVVIPPVVHVIEYVDWDYSNLPAGV